jgi:hypothetical protein
MTCFGVAPMLNDPFIGGGHGSIMWEYGDLSWYQWYVCPRTKCILAEQELDPVQKEWGISLLIPHLSGLCLL